MKQFEIKQKNKKENFLLFFPMGDMLTGKPKIRGREVIRRGEGVTHAGKVRIFNVTSCFK